MEIIEIKQNWPSDRLLINYAIHNVCNYRCQYCFKGSNEGTYRWPNLELVTSNLLYLIEYYRKNLGKTQMQLNLLGGEPTLWPELSLFVERLKDKLGNKISIMITTNGSRSEKWWERNGYLFDHVLISCHPEFVNTAHIINVADLLYEKKVHVDTSVLMDVMYWDRAVNIIKELKSSKRRWSIIASQVIYDTPKYSLEQEEFLKKYLKRMPNLFWFYRVNKEHNYKVSIIDKNHKVTNVKKNYLLIHNLNYFQGWDCDIGIDNISIQFTGDLTGSCGEFLYKLDIPYNLYDIDFALKFNPKLISTTCKKIGCFCEHEYNTNKRKTE